MNFHGFQGFSSLGRSLAPKETSTRSQLAAMSSIFMDFMSFHKTLQDLMYFSDFRGSGWLERLAACEDGVKRNLALKETFIRSQLAAISSIFMDFMCFHRFSWVSCRISGVLAG